VAGGKPVFVIDTLLELAKGPTKGANVFVIGGEDLVNHPDAKKTLPNWKDADKLIRDYNWVIAHREGQGDGNMRLPAEFVKDHKKLDDNHYLSPTGKVLHLVDINLSDISSTHYKTRVAQARDVFHQVA